MKVKREKKIDMYRDLLQLFVKGNRSQPTKEFLTTRLVRCLIRAFECIRNNRLPDKTAIKIDPKNKLQNMYWCMLVEHYRENQSQPSILFSGHGKLKTEVKFNCIFFREFFNESSHKKAMRILISLLYSDSDHFSLSEKFNFFCCLNSIHSVSCTNKWAKLQEFLTSSFLEYY